MLVVKLSDGTAAQEVTIYNEVLEQGRNFVKEDALLFIEAKVRYVRRSGDDGEETFLRVAAEKIYDLVGARAKFARSMRLVCNGQSDGARLRELLSPYKPGSCPVTIQYSNHDAECRIDLGQEWRVKLEDNLIRSLSDWLQPENVQIVY